MFKGPRPKALSAFGFSIASLALFVTGCRSQTGMNPRILPAAPDAELRLSQSAHFRAVIQPNTQRTGDIYSVLYRFKGPPDGEFPETGVVAVNGTLYGTTPAGGAKKSAEGTLFKLSTTGAERVIYSFGGAGDAAGPGALLNANGELYGTGGGGTHHAGTVFKASTSGVERVLYSFPRSRAGNRDYGYSRLTEVSSEFYGTTYLGGTGCGGLGCGTVFKVTPAGEGDVIYSFRGKGNGDGANPQDGLLNVNGRLYGTTTYGGSGCGTSGCGTVFEITRAGKERILYRFQGYPDTAYPYAGLTLVNGKLYGTTAGGSHDRGAVFEVSLNGVEGIIYRFKGGNKDGYSPRSRLTYANGALYGTTIYGVANGFGTLFTVSVSGKEQVLHTFMSGLDGQFPSGDLTYLNGAIYGTTRGNEGGTAYRYQISKVHN